MKMEYHYEDQSLLSAIKNGDEKAFDVLFKKYYPMLCAYGNKFVELEDAEECVQDAMIWLWENKEVLVIQSSLSSYLFSIVHHRAINRINQNEIKSRAENYFYEEMQSLIEDANFYHIEELTIRIQEAVAALPESYKEAFMMHRFKNMSYKEIAGILEVSPKTIDYRIQQALKQLRIDLKDYLPLLLPLLMK
ncbi:RNA polymerase sigma-70 factor [Phocaeicola faecalis]|uniref:RNA polymerase sigma-70 factor n=2 Tax=Phocaeicola TaxID=909656 RepID=UPI003529D2BC